MKHYIGIDIGATNTKLGLVDLQGNILKQEYFDSKNYTPKKLLEKLSYEINILKKNYVLKEIGVGVAGPTNPKKGKVHYFVNLDGWEDVNVADIIKTQTDIDTYIDNDTNVMALGEKEFGAGKNFQHFISLTLGTGVGGSIVLNNKLYRGSKYVAGEIGHIPIDLNGPQCNCGGTGCLERYVGSKYIAQRAKKKIKSENSIIMRLVNNKKSEITPKIISKACSLGDKISEETWIETGNYIGIALTGIVNLLNPEVIIIGGGIAKTGEILFDAIYDTIQKRAMGFHKKDLKIRKAELEEKAGIVGASVLPRSIKKNNG